MDNLSTQDIVDADLADWRKLAQRLHARFRTGDPGVGAAFLADAVRAAVRGLARRAPRGVADAPTWTCGSRDPGPRASGFGRRRHAGPAAQRRGPAARGDLRARRGQPGRVRARHRGRRPDRPVLGRAAHRRRRRRGARHGVRPDRPAAVGVVPGHRAARGAASALAPGRVGGTRGGRSRIAAAVAAGGAVVYDSEAPSFTMLADPDGNKVCVCTFLDRA